jgi:hypothetical protein
VDAGKVRHQAQHFAILFEGLGGLLLGGIGIPEIVMRLSIARSQVQGFLVGLNRLVPLALARGLVALLQELFCGCGSGLRRDTLNCLGGLWRRSQSRRALETRWQNGYKKAQEEKTSDSNSL